MKIDEKYKTQIKMLIAIFAGTIILTLIYYFFIPYTLNYPKGTYATSFQTELENTNYNFQIILIAICICAFSVIVTLGKTRFLPKCMEMIENPDNYSIKQINEIKNKLIKSPFQIYILHIIIPSIILTVVHSYTIKQFGITTLKLFIFMCSIMTLYVTFLYIYETHLFKKILEKLPHDSLDGIKKTKFQSRIFTNVLPLFIVSLFFISLVGYSHLSKQKGNLIHEKYYTIFNILFDNEIFDIDEALGKLEKLNLEKNSYIFYKIDDKYYNSKKEEITFSAYFTKYLNEISDQNNGRVYEYYGYDAGATTKKILIDSKEYIIGVYYQNISLETLKLYLYVIIILILINSCILIVFANSTKSEFDTINNSFEDMIKSEDNNFEKLKLTSTDEFGKLIILYNQIQDINKERLDMLHKNQETLMERERLASLGQLISGIAHNLKTPIMSISGCARKCEDLAKEYELSIVDSEVTKEDHKEIANDIKEQANKIKEYSEYMSDIISAVKGQAVQVSNKEENTFTIPELIKKVNILLKHELKQSLVYLNITNLVEDNLEIKGDINSLIQVLNNIISNAIQAYDNKENSIIDFEVKLNENYLDFKIIDYGPKVPEEIRDKIFKQMITTKGKNGTGLGLYMSYSTIKAKFDGTIILNSNDTQTEFIIKIPIEKIINL